MHHFHIKSLTFYGIAIGSVLLLFKTITAYGESHLKAPPVVNGSYQLKLAANLPNCNNLYPLVLNIQQSGIYLSAALFAENANAEIKKQLSLTGILKNQQISLSGSVAPEVFCDQPKSQSYPRQSIMMQMQLVDQGKIAGQLNLNRTSQPLRFIAIQKAASEQSQKLNQH